MKNLISMAEKGSLADFKTCLAEEPHSPSGLFLAIRTALLWKQRVKVQLLFEAGADPDVPKIVSAAFRWRWSVAVKRLMGWQLLMG
jgi:hypothetical protein